MKNPAPLRIPAPMPAAKFWLVLGIDPSMSRSGFALMKVLPNETTTTARWLKVGSVKPRESSDPVWVRGKAMALFLKELLIADSSNTGEIGLIISMEFPTPMNDFLVALNRIIHLVFFEGELYKQFSDVRILTTNAATLRSLMGLVKKGAHNKDENIMRAYDFLDRTQFPGLDSDACDAVMLGMVGRYAASIMLGSPDEVPERFKQVLCDVTPVKKGHGRNERIEIKGLLHNPKYWYGYQRKQYEIVVKDARIPAKKRLENQTLEI